MRDGWRQVTLGNVTLPVKKQAPSGAFVYVDISSVSRDSKSIEMPSTFAVDDAPGRARQHLSAGDVLVSTVRPNLNAVAMVPADLDGAIGSTGFSVLRADSSQVLSGFLFAIVRHDSFVTAMTERATGSNYPAVTERAVREFAFPCPPLDCQRRIVDLIGAIDGSIDAADREADSLLASLESIRDLVLWGGPRRTPLGQIAHVIGGLVDPTSAENSTLPHIGTERISSNTGDLHGVLSAAEDAVTSGKYLHDPGTIIYSKIRPNLRKVSIPTWRGLCSADAYPIRPIDDAASVSFLRHVLISRPFTEIATSRSGRTKMPKINRSELFSIEVPDIELPQQMQIAEQLDAIDAARLAAHATADALRVLRANMLTVLLSGEHAISVSYDRFLEEVAA